jgi:hypothetical protein
LFWSRLNFSRKTYTQGPGQREIRVYLPVATREIRVAAHDRGLYRGRVAIAGVGLLATAWLLYSMFQFSGQASSAIGLQVFSMQAWAAFILACSAFIATADSISREKRDGTLGLLFLTHLKGRDVILGKLVSAVALFFSGGIATLPILTLPILLGGIRLSQSIYLLVTLLATMLFSASAGLFASSVSLKRQKAAGLATIIVLGFSFFIPLLVLGLRKTGDLEIAYALQFLTPLYMQQIASSAVIGVLASHFWISFAVSMALSFALLTAASIIAPRTWQQRAREPLLHRLTARHAAWTLRTINSRSALGRRLLDRNAYEWLASRQKSAGTNAINFIAMIVLLAVAAILNFTRHNDPSHVLITTCLPALYLIHMSMKIRIGGHASDRFAEDRESNALELLLCTPLTIREMLKGEFRALRRHYILPGLIAATLAVIGLWLSQGGIDHLAQLFSTDGGLSAHRIAIAVVVTGFYFQILDGTTLAWAGAWCGLASRKVQQARNNTTALVNAAPNLLFIAIVPAVLQSPAARAYLQSHGFVPAFSLTVLFFTGCDLVIIYLARRWLTQDVRERLTSPVVHSRESSSFFAFFWPKLDRNPPLKIGNATKAG